MIRTGRLCVGWGDAGRSFGVFGQPLCSRARSFLLARRNSTARQSSTARAVLRFARRKQHDQRERERARAH